MAPYISHSFPGLHVQVTYAVQEARMRPRRHSLIQEISRNQRPISVVRVLFGKAGTGFCLHLTRFGLV